MVFVSTVELLILVIGSTIEYSQSQQLLMNPGFEQPLDDSDWFCKGNCDLFQSTNAHTGLYSARVTDRDETWKTVGQYVDLTPHTTYYFECYVQILNQTAGSLYEFGKLGVQIDYNGTNGVESHYQTISRQPYLTPERGWIKMAGDFYIKQSGKRYWACLIGHSICMFGFECKHSKAMMFCLENEILQTRMYIQIDSPNIAYLVDTSSLVKLTLNPLWKDEANARIDSIRKSDVTINLAISGEYNPNEITLEVNQTSHHFGFGSAVNEDQMIGTDEDSQQYRQCFFENFHYSVFTNAHKWKAMEWSQDKIIFPDEAFYVLRDNGIPVRGHCLFWNWDERVPNWVLPLNAEDTVEQMRKRVNYTVPRYKGEIYQWDLNNEQLHHDYFENKTGNLDFYTELFKEVQTYDEDLRLFINDYDVVQKGIMTTAMVNSVQKLLQQNTPVGGIGLQGHLTTSITPDVITAMRKRLEVVSSVGIPIWITELDINGIETDSELADAYDDVITLFFSDPSIEGIILWGFSDLHHWRPDAAMFIGPDYIPNASGLRWQEMTRERWHSSATFVASSAEDTFGFRGFQGGYLLKVIYEGAVIEENSFYLDKEDTTINIDV